jgi:predicted phosphodiesterase
MPYDDRRALKAVIGAIGDLQPDEVIHIGDLMDYPTPARWSKGTAEEFAQQVKRDNEQAKKRFLGPLRDVYDGPVYVHEGNHDLRPREYLTKYAPALAEFDQQFGIWNMLEFDAFDVRMLPEFYRVAPGWYTTHGHRGKISLSQNAGSTAINGAKRVYESLIMGHTHRLGLVYYTTGVGGNVSRVLGGMEVGHLMDQREADYLKGGTGNWQQGFGMLTVEGKYVKPEPVPIIHGRFSVDGHVWKV